MPEDQKTVDDPSGTTETESSGESELDAFLKEYEASSKEKSRTKPDAKSEGLAKVLRGLEPVVKFADSEMKRQVDEKGKKAIDDTLEFMTEPEELKDMPPRFARGFLEAYAIENADFQKAFDGRTENPSTWKDALDKARDVFVEDFKKLPGSKVKSDVEAATAAVQGASTKADTDEGPPPAVKGKMSDQDWTEYLEKTYPESA